MREMKSVYRILGRKPEGKRPLGRPRCRWQDNIRIDLRETVWAFVDSIHVVQGGRPM
jgi:hypothetical protein